MQIMFKCFHIVLLVVALAGLFVSSWGACVSGDFRGCNVSTGRLSYSCGSSCGYEYVGDYIKDCPSTCVGLTGFSFSNSLASMCGGDAGAGCSWGGTTFGVDCKYTTSCDTQAEADSVACVNSGSNWVNGQCKNCDASDPSSWKCETTSSIVKAQESSPDIICDASFGGCYSGNACAIYTEYQTSCVNECTGDSTVESYRTDPIWQDGFCDEVDIDRDDCGKTRCIDMDGNFALVHDCSSNNIINGVPQTFPVVIQGGKGSCASNGYQPVNPDSLNNGNSSNRDSILKAHHDSLYSQNCLLFGQCGDANDSTDFSDASNRNAENGCYCERMDDMLFVSRIICPDGTSSIFYGSCKYWQDKPSSSSSSSPQSSESGGGGSSEADSRPTDWANWSQANEMNQKLDANNGILASISEKLSNIFSFLSGGGGSGGFDNSDGLTTSIDWDNPQYVDSSLVYDTNQVSIFGDVSDSLFNLARSNKGLLDTSSLPDLNNCFTCRFIFTQHLGGQSVELNFGSLGGFNICTLLRSILIVLTEIACLVFFIKVFLSTGGK